MIMFLNWITFIIPFIVVSWCLWMFISWCRCGRLNRFTPPETGLLIGYKIGDHVYHPDDVTLVYGGNDAEPITDASSGQGC